MKLLRELAWHVERRRVHLGAGPGKVLQAEASEPSPTNVCTLPYMTLARVIRGRGAHEIWRLIEVQVEREDSVRQPNKTVIASLHSGAA
jgi:hypothetical protein